MSKTFLLRPDKKANDRGLPADVAFQFYVQLVHVEPRRQLFGIKVRSTDDERVVMRRGPRRRTHATPCRIAAAASAANELVGRFAQLAFRKGSYRRGDSVHHEIRVVLN